MLFDESTGLCSDPCFSCSEGLERTALTDDRRSMEAERAFR